MKGLLLFSFVSLYALANPLENQPTSDRTTPPTIESISPHSVTRGTSQILEIEGLNLFGASDIYFSDDSVTAQVISVKEIPPVPEEVRLGAGGFPSTVDLGPLPARYSVSVQITIKPDADIGILSFRLDTPMGTSPTGKVLIEPYFGEQPDSEPNNNPGSATKASLPSILAGTISAPGDEDYFQITAREGEELIFEEGAWSIGSNLKPLISILSHDYELLREFGRTYEETLTHWFAHTFSKNGTYYIRLSDYEKGGSKNHFYRLKIGKFPIVKSAYPLGVQKDKITHVSVEGHNLPQKQFPVTGNATHSNSNTIFLRPKSQLGKSFNKIKLALEDYPEITSTGVNISRKTAQTVQVPRTINGYIPSHSAQGNQSHYFKFTAKKNEKIILEVNASRLGSRLDSLVHILNAQGDLIERATVRAVAHTNTTLKNWESTSPRIRLNSYKDFTSGDFVMMGSEIAKVARVPHLPDDDIFFTSWPPSGLFWRDNSVRRFAQRRAFFGTSPEGQALNTPVYKVNIHPPGKNFTSNGLPLVRLYYLNDDGGPGYGQDSRLEFTAPVDGSYFARLQDVHGGGGENYPYRLTLRRPRPDFRLLADPSNLNVPRGGDVPIIVFAERIDGFNGPIDVTLENLPLGVTATRRTIAPGQLETTLLVSAEINAAVSGTVPLKIKGAADVAGQRVLRLASPEDKLKFISVSPPADIEIVANTRNITLTPGEDFEITVSAKRKNGFAGRILLAVLNLPLYTDIPEMGLSGIVIPAGEKSLSFHIRALPQAMPMEQWIQVTGRVETRSPLQNAFAAHPILLRIDNNVVETTAYVEQQ